MKKGTISVKKPRGKGKPFLPGPDSRRHVHGPKNVLAVVYPIEAVNEMAKLMPPKEWAKIIVEGVRRNRPGYKELFAKYVLGEPPQRHEHSGANGGPINSQVTFLMPRPNGDGKTL